VEVGDGRVVQCVESALSLAVREEAPLALVLSRGGDHPMRLSLLRLEGVSPAPGPVSGLLREAMREHNVFRGRIISLHQDEHGGSVGVQFHTVAAVRGLAGLEQRWLVAGWGGWGKTGLTGKGRVVGGGPARGRGVAGGAGPSKHTGVMAPVAPGWVSGIA
jgi:hypothetical protein